MKDKRLIMKAHDKWRAQIWEGLAIIDHNAWVPYSGHPHEVATDVLLGLKKSLNELSIEILYEKEEGEL